MLVYSLFVNSSIIVFKPGLFRDLADQGLEPDRVEEKIKERKIRRDLAIQQDLIKKELTRIIRSKSETRILNQTGSGNYEENHIIVNCVLNFVSIFN